MVKRSIFRFSIRFWFILLVLMTSVLWGSYSFWDYQCEKAADRYIQLMNWKDNQDYQTLKEATESLDAVTEERVAKKLQEKFPLVSIADRLAYEKKSEKYADSSASITDPKPRTLGGMAGALKAIHEGKVKSFVGSPGFGVMRTVPRPAVFYLARKESSPNESPAMGKLNRNDFSDRFGEEILVAKQTSKVNSSSEKRDLATGRRKRRSEFNRSEMFIDAHSHVTRDFSDTADVYVRSPDEVAGFDGHEINYFRWRTDKAEDQNDSDYPIRFPDIGARRFYGKIIGENYAVQRVDLVSLLVHQKPLVYVSEKLPNMEELSPDVMRKLDSFEKSALVKLQNGQDLVAREKDDTILMLGPIRASKQCLDCHSVQEGELLGAFSYVLKVLD